MERLMNDTGLQKDSLARRKAVSDVRRRRAGDSILVVTDYEGTEARMTEADMDQDSGQAKPVLDVKADFALDALRKLGPRPRQ